MLVFLKSLKKGFSWLILTILFGLLQLWWVIFYTSVHKELSFDLYKILEHGILLFFSTSLVTSVMIDFFLAKGAEYSRSIIGIFVFFPILILMTSTLLFSILTFNTFADLNISLIHSIQFAILTMSIIYAGGIKSLLIYEQD